MKTKEQIIAEYNQKKIANDAELANKELFNSEEMVPFKSEYIRLIKEEIGVDKFLLLYKSGLLHQGADSNLVTLSLPNFTDWYNSLT